MQLLKHLANAMQRAEGFVLERALVLSCVLYPCLYYMYMYIYIMWLHHSLSLFLCIISILQYLLTLGTCTRVTVVVLCVSVCVCYHATCYRRHFYVSNTVL